MTSERATGCTMGVGCDEAGVCWAAAQGHPERCPKAPVDTEQIAWAWLNDYSQQRHGEHPADIGFDADQMVDAFLAGQALDPEIGRLREALEGVEAVLDGSSEELLDLDEMCDRALAIASAALTTARGDGHGKT